MCARLTLDLTTSQPNDLLSVLTTSLSSSAPTEGRSLSFEVGTPTLLPYVDHTLCLSAPKHNADQQPSYGSYAHLMTGESYIFVWPSSPPSSDRRQIVFRSSSSPSSTLSSFFQYLAFRRSRVRESPRHDLVLVRLSKPRRDEGKVTAIGTDRKIEGSSSFERGIPLARYACRTLPGA